MYNNSADLSLRVNRHSESPGITGDSRQDRWLVTNRASRVMHKLARI